MHTVDLSGAIMGPADYSISWRAPPLAGQWPSCDDVLCDVLAGASDVTLAIVGTSRCVSAAALLASMAKKWTLERRPDGMFAVFSGVAIGAAGPAIRRRLQDGHPLLPVAMLDCAICAEMVT